jgi:hypothetical protein
LEFETAEGNRIAVTADVVTFKDVAKFAGKLTATVKGVRKALPEIAQQKVVNVRLPKEK